MNAEPLTDSEKEEISQALIAGRKLDAIKQYRRAAGTGLKEAREAVAELEAALAKTHPDMVTRTSGGCMSVILLGAMFLFAVIRLYPFVTV